jgi:hypothetical protein
MNELDRGAWRIMHPGEIMATFLFPLPDPLPLPDGAVLPTYQPLETATIQILEPWLEQLWLQAVDGSGVEPCNSMLESEGGTPSRVNWSNKFTLSTSIQIHQTFSDAGLRVGLEPALRLAEVVSGPSLSSDDKARALDTFASTASAGAELRDLGLGAVTVAECVVGLRIIGDVPNLESPLTQGVPRDPPYGPIESDRIYMTDVGMWQWRVLGTDALSNAELIERRMRNALTIAIDALASLQRATQALRRTPMTILTQERLPFVVPVVARNAQDVGTDQSAPVTLLATRPDVPHLQPEPFTDEEMRFLHKALGRVAGGAFSAHLDMHRETHVALDRQGDHRLAALLSGIAAESLLDELMLHLMWEEGLTPEQAARNWGEGLDFRVRTELPRRLGGSWDVTRRGPIGVWSQDVAALRHRVVHAAYIPSVEEAQGSFRGLNGLVTHLCDRLARPEVLKSYPRTAVVLAGEGGLHRRGAYKRRIRDLETDPNEVPWNETFYRWREAWRRTRQDLSTGARVPDQRNAWLLAIRHPDRTVCWVLHDRQQHLAIEVELADDEPYPGFLEQLHALADSAHLDDGYPSPLSVAFTYAGESTPRPGATWVEEYHHVPITEVMVDRSDYRQPARP